ncbi:hypothetical protein D3C72_2554130 [compost metagenome]
MADLERDRVGKRLAQFPALDLHHLDVADTLFLAGLIDLTQPRQRQWNGVFDNRFPDSAV